MKLKELPINELPRERLIKVGETNLTNEELLSIIIRTGTKDTSVKEVSNNILSKVSSINELNNITLEELSNIKGVGIVKAITIKASIELLTNKQSLLLAKVTSKQNELKTFIEYYKNNSDYLRNECIIEGIRNSISHGNYRVKAESSLEECKIIFEDIYEGELTFKAQIKLLDFITLLVNNHNIISNFVDNKSKKLSLKS